MHPDTEDLMTIQAPLLRATHGFTTRRGGVSAGAYAGLNLDDRQDDPAAVHENRRRLVTALGFQLPQVARLDQVHGDEVRTAQPGVQTGDALVTDRPGVLLSIMTADCYPLLLEDPEAGVLGAAHAGWRGTVGRIGVRTVEAMVRLGARPERIRAAVGPGISAGHYQVGPEVEATFIQAELGTHLQDRHLDLAGANRQVLLEAGVPEGHIWMSGRCSTEADFYSHRRDQGVTGRMWAVIGTPLMDAGEPERTVAASRLHSASQEALGSAGQGGLPVDALVRPASLGGL
ncbi:peptidoglycan editing factor PgeF [Deinococcus sonorensis]|uniref:Purine nucleoside phosphorylase n=2 Tax=Deinococcus sonorensis TaxID=309891 RepID=A0AAU7UEP6_9DEIO